MDALHLSEYDYHEVYKVPGTEEKETEGVLMYCNVIVIHECPHVSVFRSVVTCITVICSNTSSPGAKSG